MIREVLHINVINFYIAVARALDLTLKQKPVAVEPLTPEELKQILSQSKENDDDDCLMCGS